MTRSLSIYLIVPATLLSLTGCGVFSLSVEPASTPRGIPRATIIEGSLFEDSATVIPGPEYEAGWLHRVLFGDHYRDLWTSPLQVKILDVAGFAGGLTPIKQGGGFQTKSLRLQGNDGRQYAFRSVNKDPAKTLPPELQTSLAADVMKDQISSSNPAAPMVADVLADALGILHAKPMFYLLPDDERLGEFRQEFAGLLGILEEYPGSGGDGRPGFAGARKVISTVKLFETLEKDSDERVNSRAFLTARLLDILVGDWDRHIDQWRWARFDDGERHVWYPIPRDRDQAFARLDGLLPWMGTVAITQLSNFDSEFCPITDLTFSGRYLDRRFLVDLDKATWDSITSDVIAKLTDAVIDSAVRTLPPSFAERRATWLAGALKARRAHLKEAAEEYYRQLAGFVDIRLSDKQEVVEVRRVDDRRTEVRAYRRSKKSGEVKGEAVYHRVFHEDETKEIRLYLLGADDKVVVSGTADCAIVLHVIGGSGDDELVDESHVRGPWLGFVPFIRQTAVRTFFYDHQGTNSLIAGRGTAIDTDNYEEPPHGVAQY